GVVHVAEVVIRDASEKVGFRISKRSQAVDLVSHSHSVFPVLLSGGDYGQAKIWLRILGIGVDRLLKIVGRLVELLVALMDHSQKGPRGGEPRIFLHRLGQFFFFLIVFGEIFLRFFVGLARISRRLHG